MTAAACLVAGIVLGVLIGGIAASWTFYADFVRLHDEFVRLRDQLDDWKNEQMENQR